MARYTPQKGSYAAATAQGAEDFNRLAELFERVKNPANLTDADRAFLQALTKRAPIHLRPQLKMLINAEYKQKIC